jgi:hypothetical protein
VQEVTSSSAVTLGDIADKLAMLEVACFPMRAARPSVANLIERHGADAQLTNLRTVLAGDCPRIGGAICEQCRVHSPQLRDRWGGTATLKTLDRLNYIPSDREARYPPRGLKRGAVRLRPC